MGCDDDVQYMMMQGYTIKHIQLLIHEHIHTDNTVVILHGLPFPENFYYWID